MEIFGFDILKCSDRPNVRFGRTYTVRFGPNDRPFFCRTGKLFFALHSMPMASFHILVLLNEPHWSSGKIAKRMPTEPKLE